MKYTIYFVIGFDGIEIPRYLSQIASSSGNSRHRIHKVANSILYQAVYGIRIEFLAELEFIDHWKI